MAEQCLDDILKTANLDRLCSLLYSYDYAVYIGCCSLIEQRDRIAGVMKSRYGFNDEGVSKVVGEWRTRILTEEYTSSLCSSCSCGDGLENYLACGGTRHCHGNGWFSFGELCKDKCSDFCRKNQL